MTDEQYRILKELDVDAALKRVAAQGFIPEDREIALAGLHKARVIARARFTEFEVQASKQWLRKNDYKIPQESI